MNLLGPDVNTQTESEERDGDLSSDWIFNNTKKLMLIFLNILL